MNNLAHNANCDLHKLAENFLLTLKDGPLAIAVSGGSDSIAVLDLLSKANSHNRVLHCFTVDHQLREEAKFEAQFVSDFCADRNIAHQTLVWDEMKPERGLQNAARWARYKLLDGACRDIGAVGLVTGHNLDDQVETIYMRLQRDKTGEGAGLSGMAPAALFFQTMWVLRPFLSVGKQELKDHLVRSSINWKEDPSNIDEKYERVRVRHKIDIDIDIADIASHAQNRKFISNSAARYISQNCRTLDGLVFELTILDHKQQVVKKVLEVLVHLIGGRDRSLSRDDVISLYDFAISKVNARTTMGRVILDKRENVIQLYRENRGFEENHLNGGETMNWDGRFLIENHRKDISCSLRQDANELGCPPLIKWPGDDEWLPVSTCKVLSIKPIINKYDHVLSEFDFELANAVARLRGRSEFLLPFDSAKLQNQEL
ncbi:MAG: tRNA lysidine(34) synthetase TilS [Lentilitoribacter sp.]